MNVSMMTRSSQETEEPRWAVRLERGAPSPATEMRKRHQRSQRFRGARVFVMSTFLFHLVVYSLIMLMLLFINLMTWEGFLWMAFPAVAWGGTLAIHGGFAWMIANIGVASKAVDRAQEPVRVPVIKKKETAEDANRAELNRLMHEGLVKVDAMRAIGRNMRSPGARKEAISTVNSIEGTLAALEGNVDDLPLARDFIGGLIDPAHRLFVEYDRLSRRDIQGAKALLQQVEQHDLPRITQKAEDLHDRVHRGTMIDLQVAREMLSLTSAGPKTDE